MDTPAASPPDMPAFTGEAPDQRAPVARRSAAWFAGALGAAVSLAIGEVADRFSDALTSLVVGVGELLVDITPGQVVETSINNIGSLQKPLLLMGVTFGAIFVGGWLATVGRRRPAIVAAGFFGFGLLGAFATARLDLTDAAGSAVVALGAAAVGAATTLTLLHLARPIARPVGEAGVIVPGSALSQRADRRRVLAFGGAAVGAAALTGVGRIGRTSAAQRARDQILTDAATSTTVPGATAKPAPTLTAGGFDDVQGISSFITPISPKDEFYLIDTALSKPQVDPKGWALTIDGDYVTAPVTYTYDELMARDHMTREVTLSCVSNPVGGDLVGNAVWTGIALSELFEDAGIIDPTDATTQVFSRSVDGFTCGFPVPLAYDGRTAMLALTMNGEPLPIDHGFPARLVIAGLYGYVSATKWVERISITDWVGVDGFWMPRGWSKEGPVKTQSRIDVPRNGAQVSAGSTTIAGIAWAPTIGIEGVEVAIGEGESWQAAELAVVESNETWVQWKLDWDAPVGDHLIRVRATDKAGFTQSPIPVAPAPDGAEGHHTIAVRVT